MTQVFSASAQEADTHRATDDGTAQRHTPGPLTVNGRGVVCVANSHGYQRPVKLAGAWIEGAWEGNEEALANATLYAAAPDLLEAGVWLLSAFMEAETARGNMRAEMSPAYVAMRAAIAKATRVADSASGSHGGDAEGVDQKSPAERREPSP